jgi:hypothetical protein
MRDEYLAINMWNIRFSLGVFLSLENLDYDDEFAYHEFTYLIQWERKECNKGLLLRKDETYQEKELGLQMEMLQPSKSCVWMA